MKELIIEELRKSSCRWMKLCIQYSESAEGISSEGVLKNLKMYLALYDFDCPEKQADGVAKRLLKQFPQITQVEVWCNQRTEEEIIRCHVIKKWEKIYLSMTSFLEGGEDTLNRVIDTFYECENCRVTAVSNFVTAEIVGEAQNRICGCVEIETLQALEEIRELISDVEREEAVEMEILLYEDKIIDGGSIRIPPLKLHQQREVLEGLNQIAPYAIHPVYGKTIMELLQQDNKDSGCSGCSGCAMKQK